MPKKSRRMKERAALRRSTMPEATVSPEGAAAESRTTLSPSTRVTFAMPSFDYSHIYSDLRRIAFFAIFFFAVLIALSFVIQ